MSTLAWIAVCCVVALVFFWIGVWARDFTAIADIQRESEEEGYREF